MEEMNSRWQFSPDQGQPPKLNYPGSGKVHIRLSIIEATKLTFVASYLMVGLELLEPLHDNSFWLRNEPSVCQI